MKQSRFATTAFQVSGTALDGSFGKHLGCSAPNSCWQHLWPPAFKSNQRAQINHQKVQSETAHGAPENQTGDASRHHVQTLAYQPQPLTTHRPPGNPMTDHNQRAETKHQKAQPETNGAPETPDVFPKRSTRKSIQRAQMKHQKAQSETTNGARMRPEVFPKRSTSKSNQRAQMKHQKTQLETTNGAPHKPEVCAKIEHQQVQPESTHEAPQSTIRDHKRSTREVLPKWRTSKSNQRARSTTKQNQRPRTEHQTDQSFFQNRAPARQSESTNEARESTIKDHKRRSKKSAKKIFQTFPFKNCFNWPSYPAIAVLLCTTTLAQSTSQ